MCSVSSEDCWRTSVKSPRCCSWGWLSLQVTSWLTPSWSRQSRTGLSLACLSSCSASCGSPISGITVLWQPPSVPSPPRILPSCGPSLLRRPSGSWSIVSLQLPSTLFLIPHASLWWKWTSVIQESVLFFAAIHPRPEASLLCIFPQTSLSGEELQHWRKVLAVKLALKEWRYCLEGTKQPLMV